MAANTSSNAAGKMDIRQNQDTYEGFIKVSVWGSGFVVIVLALMAIFIA